MVALSKRAKVRMKNSTQAERKQVHKAAKTLYEAELMGPKRYQEIIRWCKKGGY